jgi:pilus assembly protein FimV
VSELGFARSEAGQVMQAIVARNPQAFVGGDADRLRVGALLDVPARGATAVITQDTDETLPQAVAPATASITPKPATEAVATPAALTAPVAATVEVPGAADEAARLQAEDAALAARLAELSRKFAAIRTRYAAQQSLAAATSRENDAPAAVEGDGVASAPVASAAAPAVASDPVVAPVAAPAATSAVDTAVPATALPLDLRIVLGVGMLLTVVGIVAVLSYSVRRRRMHRADGAAIAADQERLAEIARKTEKRLQLEGEVAEWLGRKKKPASVVPGLSFEEIDNRIAHGQYAEAERMLGEVIAATPANYRAKLRLAEIFYLNERTDEFVELAGELQSRHRADIGDDGWQRVMRMGRVLAPDRPPFSGPVALEHEA